MAMTGGKAYRVRHVKANYGNANWYIDLYVYVKEKSQSVANNNTVLSLGVYAVTPSGYDIGPWYKSTDSYIGTATSGTNCKTFDGAIPNFSGTRWLIENQEITVPHDADGSKTVKIYWKWGVNSPWGQCVNPSGSFDVDLTDIPRASSITSISAITLGKTATIKWTPASKSFYYRVKLILGSSSAWLTSGVKPGVTSAYTHTIPAVAYSPFAEVLTDDPPSGSATIELYTYKDSSINSASQIGKTTKAVTVTVPENSTTKPTAPTVTLTPVDSISDTFASLYIQGLSKVKAVISAPTDGKYGAEISSYATSVGGKSKSGSTTTSDYLTTSGSVNVVSTVTDSRGFSNSTTNKITVIPYTKPSVIPYGSEKAVVCERCTSDGTLSASGTYLRIKAGRRYSKVESGGKQYNYCLLRYRYKASTSDTYSTWTTLIAKDATSNSVDKILDGIVTSITTSYDVQINAIDDVGKSHTLTFTVPTDKVNFHEREGGDGAAFGKYSERPKALEIAEDWELVVYGDRWQSLPYSSAVSASTSAGACRGPANDAIYYRVENGNHVYIAFNCAFNFTGEAITINATDIPAEYRPSRAVYAMCATGGRAIARIMVNSAGKVIIDWIQILSSAEATTSSAVSWIDGYIDYFILP
jgi:hypothetical protein